MLPALCLDLLGCSGVCTQACGRAEAPSAPPHLGKQTLASCTPLLAHFPSLIHLWSVTDTSSAGPFPSRVSVGTRAQVKPEHVSVFVCKVPSASSTSYRLAQSDTGTGRMGWFQHASCTGRSNQPGPERGKTSQLCVLVAGTVRFLLSPYSTHEPAHPSPPRAPALMVSSVLSIPGTQLLALLLSPNTSGWSRALS